MGRGNEWLGGRDSNPDSQIQSLVSYHWTTSQQRTRIYVSRPANVNRVVSRATIGDSLLSQSKRKACGDFKIVLLPDSNQSRIRALTAPAVDGAGNPPCYWSSVNPDLQEQMSEEHSSAETSELARLRAMVAEYETKLIDAATLVARVRHEINNPLAGLLGQAQLLLREELSDKTRGRVQIIEELAKRIEKIGSELRDVQTPVAAVNRADE